MKDVYVLLEETCEGLLYYNEVPESDHEELMSLEDAKWTKDFLQLQTAVICKLIKVEE